MNTVLFPTMRLLDLFLMPMLLLPLKFLLLSLLRLLLLLQFLQLLLSLVPECPVCLESMKPPLQIFTCGNGHQDWHFVLILIVIQAGLQTYRHIL